jgi:hypothetical protein
MKPKALRSTAPAPLRVRQEIFSLGGRHRGDALAGARIELGDEGLTPERRALLRSVISHLSGDAVTTETANLARAPLGRITVADAVHIGVIVATTLWGVFVISGRLG